MELKEYLDELNKLNEAKDDYEYDKKNISFTEYDDDLEYAYSEWAVVKSKTVEDEDGEETKLVWYYRTGDPLHLFMLGDPETTEPNEGEAEFTTESITEARRFFKDYDDYVEESLTEDIDDEEKDYIISLIIKHDVECKFIVRDSHREYDLGKYGIEYHWDEDNLSDFDTEYQFEIEQNYLFDSLENSIKDDIDYINKKLNINITDIETDSHSRDNWDSSEIWIYAEATKKPDIEECKRVFEKYVNVELTGAIDDEYYDDEYYDEATYNFTVELQRIEIEEN